MAIATIVGIVLAIQLTSDQTLEHRHYTVEEHLLQTLTSWTSHELFPASVARLLMPQGTNLIKNPGFNGLKFPEGSTEVILDSSVPQTLSQGNISPWTHGKVAINKIDSGQWFVLADYLACMLVSSAG